MKKMENEIFFTIVTVCYNEEKLIHNAMKSVLEQSFKGYEYIIIDGASSDRTVEVIESFYDDFEGRMRWISEKDNGLYDAMNKGISMAQGEYIAFINVDDTLQPDVLKKVHEVLKNDNFDLIYGDSINVYRYEGLITQKIKKANPNIDLKSLRNGMGVVHQALFTKLSLIKKLNGFNTEYRIGADWDFLIRAIKENVKTKYISIPICSFQTDGVSSQIHNKERHRIRKDNGLFRIIDFSMIKDYLNIGTMIQLFIGRRRYARLRYVYNKAKNQIIR